MLTGAVTTKPSFEPPIITICGQAFTIDFATVELVAEAVRQADPNIVGVRNFVDQLNVIGLFMCWDSFHGITSEEEGKFVPDIASAKAAYEMHSGKGTYLCNLAEILFIAGNKANHHNFVAITIPNFEFIIRDIEENAQSYSAAKNPASSFVRAIEIWEKFVEKAIRTETNSLHDRYFSYEAMLKVYEAGLLGYLGEERLQLAERVSDNPQYVINILKTALSVLSVHGPIFKEKVKK